LGVVMQETFVIDAAALPGINQRVKLLFPGEEPGEDQSAGLQTRVEDVAVTTGRNPVYDVLVAPPRYEGDVEPPRAGDVMWVVWFNERGVSRLPVEFLSLEQVGEIVSAWRLRVCGPAERVQRRHFVRVAHVTPLLITLLDDSGAPTGQAALRGMTSDLSEGGLLCVLEEELPSDCQAVVSFAFLGDDFRLEARVVRAFPNRDRHTGRSGNWATAISFINPDAAGDSLRKGIFAEQLRIRRVNGR
jgi:hypothetical protein